MEEEKYITESNTISLNTSYDCVVLGGGIAGVSAALSAKRKGCKTLILEKSVMLGGLATIGFVNKYLPLCDGKGQKVCAGISEELLHESIRYGYNTLPAVWKEGVLKEKSQLRYESVVSPYDFVIALDELIERENIDALYDTVFSASYLEEEKCTAVIVESKKGRHAYAADVFIDCTGDAELFSRSSIPCEVEKNLLSYWAYVTSYDRMAGAVKRREILHGVNLWELGAKFDGSNAEKNQIYELVTPEDISVFIKDGRKLLKKKLHDSPDMGLTVTALPAMPQARRVRRLIGQYELNVKDLNTYQESSIGCAPDWRRRGEVYEIPFGTLYSRKIKNALTAGRSISASGDTWEVTRSIPACAVTGQAAGTAASIMLESGYTVDSLPVAELQNRLSSDNVILHY